MNEKIKKLFIIKATFSDNDFTDVLERYFNTISCHGIDQFRKKINNDNPTYDELKEYISLDRKISDIINSRDEYLKDEEFLFILNLIKDRINDFIKTKISKENHEYILNNLTIELINTFSPTWENGEVCYAFINSINPKGKGIIYITQ